MSRVESIIFYVDVFLLTFAIGLNVAAARSWYDSPPSAEQYERDNIGRGY